MAEATRIADFRADSPAVAASFAEAHGDAEFQSDAAKVNTVGVWRDMKIGIFARREPAAPVTSAEWDDRDLPRPTARVAFAAIEPIDDFGPHWSKWAEPWDYRPERDLRPGGRCRVDLERGDAGVRRLPSDSRHLPRRRTHLRRGQNALRRRDAHRGGLAREGSRPAALRRLGRALRPHRSDPDQSPRTGRSRRLERIDRLHRRTLRTIELLPSTAHGPVDRQRDGRGCGEVSDRPPPETNRSPMAGRERQQDGSLCCLTYSTQWDLYWTSPKLTARFHRRTRVACGVRNC